MNSLSQEEGVRKLATLFLAAALTIGGVTSASAIDFKAQGWWIMSFDYGQNGNFTGGNGQTGFGRANEDEFEARQRVRLKFDAIASESLSGTVYLEIGEQFWGKGGTANSGGAALGADSTSVIKLRNVYIDWMPPDSDLKVRMGIQFMRMPNFTTKSQVLTDDVAGIVANYNINENASITPFWIRPFNDNFLGADSHGVTNYRQAFMDNMDMFGLIIPLTFDGIHVTPWGMIGGIGPNTFRVGNNYMAENATWGQGNFAKMGLIPAGAAMHENGTSARNTLKLDNYGTAWWAGIGGEITFWEPFKFAFDFNYGSVEWEDNGRLNRHGFLASAILEYKLDWAIPGLLGWYGSGDDSNPANGSERMPFISCNAANNFSHFAFKGEPNIARGGYLGRGMDGTWGVGIRLKDISFIENMKQTFRINFIGGTNSPAMAKKMSLNGMASNGHTYGTEQWGTNNTINYGRETMYLTTEDYAMEFGFTNVYKMYENLSMFVDMNYIALWLDKSDSVWGLSKMNGKSDETRDAWNINVAFVYSF